MSTVKITELPVLSDLDSNTSNTILVAVDLPSSVTGKITMTTMARELYSNNNLAVGNNYTILPNVVGQFTGNSSNYIQVNLQNLTGNGSGDIVVTADVGNDTDHFIDVGINGSTYNFPGYTMAKPLDGYVLVQGSNTAPSGPGGNLVVGTTTVGKDIIFTQGTFDETGRVAKFVYDTGFKLVKKPIIFADDTTQNTAVDYTTINTRITANTTGLNASIAANVATLRGEITSNISTANVFTQAAFNKANSALANTSGVFAGDLNVRGNIVAYSIATSNITSFVSDVTPATNALVEIVGSAGGVQQTPSNDGYMLHITGKPNLPSRIVSDAFGSSNNYTLFAGRSARGTATTPTATQNNDVLMRITGNGWGTTGFAPLGVARIDIVATENYTDSSRGSKIVIYNTVNGSNVIAEIASFNAQSVEFSGLVKPEKGFIYTPRILTGAQTAITVDFATDSMVRATFNSALGISFSNYITGKVVETWLTNTAGNGQTITHGCLANNSTTGSATLSVAAGRSAKLQYFSIDGDLSNTFVAVTYA